MKTATVRQKSPPTQDVPRVRKVKKKDTRISPEREWKLLYSPLTRVGRNGPSPEAKDLCWYCSHSQTCTYPKPEGGIWNCKDFKRGER